MFGEVQVDGPFLEVILNAILDKFAPDTPVTMSFRRANFNSGHDLKEFADKLGIEIHAGEVEQWLAAKATSD